MNEEQGLKNVIAYIETHLKEPLSAEEIAAACYYSRSNTKALFQKVFQYGMMEYVARRKLTQAAEELLFNKKLPSVLDYSKSSFVVDENTSDGEMMMTAMGQGNTLVSPYHMALITQAIANGGTLMEPYLVDKVTNYKGTEIRKNVPKSYKKLMTSEEALQLKDYMRAVVDEGTATMLSGQSYSVAGKTGTAEYSMTDGEKTHSWFVGFTNVDNPELVISVIIEGYDGNAGAKAVPIAKQVLDSYYYQ